jgi:lysophospholipase L1-like esterase
MSQSSPFLCLTLVAEISTIAPQGPPFFWSNTSAFFVIVLVLTGACMTKRYDLSTDIDFEEFQSYYLDAELQQAVAKRHFRDVEIYDQRGDLWVKINAYGFKGKDVDPRKKHIAVWGDHNVFGMREGWVESLGDYFEDYQFLNGGLEFDHLSNMTRRASLSNRELDLHYNILFPGWLWDKHDNIPRWLERQLTYFKYEELYDGNDKEYESLYLAARMIPNLILTTIPTSLSQPVLDLGLSQFMYNEQTDTEHVYEFWNPGLGKDIDKAGQLFFDMVQRRNDIVREIASSLNLPLIDLFEKFYEPSPRKFRKYFFDNYQFRMRGYYHVKRTIAEALQDFLGPSKLITAPKRKVKEIHQFDPGIAYDLLQSYYLTQDRRRLKPNLLILDEHEDIWVETNEHGFVGTSINPKKRLAAVWGDSVIFGIRGGWVEGLSEHFPAFQFLNGGIEGDTLEFISERALEKNGDLKLDYNFVFPGWHEEKWDQEAALREDADYHLLKDLVESMPNTILMTVPTSLSQKVIDEGMEKFFDYDDARPEDFTSENMFVFWGGGNFSPDRAQYYFDFIRRRNEVVRRVSQETGAPLVDLYEHFYTDDLEKFREDFYDIGHFRMKTYEKVKRLISEDLKDVLV